MTKRVLALALTGTLLAACAHKDKDAPLAFVPADTPYVVANLDVMDDTTRDAMLAQADAQLPTQITQIKAQADQLANTDPNTAHLLQAVATEFSGKTVAQIAQDIGTDIKGHIALYGLGLAPVARIELSDPQAFDSFVGRLETAYGKKFDVVKIGDQSYRTYTSKTSEVQVILAEVGKQAVFAALPADAPQPLVRQALGLDRPEKNLQDDGRLSDLAKAKGYQPWMVGQVDFNRLLPLVASGKDPLFQALLKAHAESESAKTGEPVANQMQIPASCQTDAARIASRVPQLSLGYTQIDAKHQNIRVDVALASDITTAFNGLKVELPGLGSEPSAPFEMSLALPVTAMRTFWGAQADAVAAKPFACPALDQLNENFASMGQAMQKAAIPPFGDLLGVHIALDSFAASADGNSMPSFTGRLLVGTNNPAALLAMAQMASPMLASLKLSADGKPSALPDNISKTIGQPVWAAMGAKSLAIAVGAGEDSKLTAMLQEPTGDTGHMMRTHIDGDMYLSWIKLMAQKAEVAASLAANTDQDAGDDSDAAQKAAASAATLASTKTQFAAMETQAARIKSVSAEAHLDDQGLVITSATELK